jgi:hypothetical protein
LPFCAPGQDGRSSVHVRTPGDGQAKGAWVPVQFVQVPPPMLQSPKNAQLENPVTLVMDHRSPGAPARVNAPLGLCTVTWQGPAFRVSVPPCQTQGLKKPPCWLTTKKSKVMGMEPQGGGIVGRVVVVVELVVGLVLEVVVVELVVELVLVVLEVAVVVVVEVEGRLLLVVVGTVLVVVDGRVVEAVGSVLVVEVVGTRGGGVVVDVVVVGHGPSRGRHLTMWMSASTRGRVPASALARTLARIWPGAFFPFRRTRTAISVLTGGEQTLPCSGVGARSWMRAGLKRVRMLASAPGGLQAPWPGWLMQIRSPTRH